LMFNMKMQEMFMSKIKLKEKAETNPYV
jgi:hypothetical protein